MGSILSSIAGAKNDYQAVDPYNQSNFQAAVGQEATLASALQNQMNGVGPNPAQQQYLQNSQAAAQQQAGMYAANRSLNPALAARMAGNTAGGALQGAASNAAVLQAQQQLAAQQQLGQLTLGQQGLMNQSRLGTSKINADVTQGNANNSGAIFSGLINSAGGIGAAAAGAAHGGFIQALASQGGAIPGQAPYAGDHSGNDIVPTMLSPGEIVIPRTQAGSADQAKAFIDSLMSSKEFSNDQGDDDSYGKVAAAKKKAEAAAKKAKK